MPSLNSSIRQLLTKAIYYSLPPPVARKEDREAGAFAQLRLHGNLTAKTHHDGLADRESEACSLLEFIFLIEAVEHHLTVVFIHAYTCVLNIEFHPVVFGRVFPTKSYRAFVRKLARIGEEVASNLLQTGVIHLYSHIRSGLYEAEVEMLRHLHLERVIDLLHQFLY